MYTTPEAVRAVLQKRGDFTPEEVNVVNGYIAAVERMFDRACGWNLETPLFEATACTMTFALDADSAYVRIVPSTEILSVKTYDVNGNLATLQPTDYLAMRGTHKKPSARKPYTLLIAVNGVVFRKAVIVEARYGLTDTVPPDIAALATQQVVIWYNAAQAALSGASSDNEHGVLRYETPAGLSRTIHKRLVELGYRLFI